LDSFDKQLIRNWLREEWDMTGVPPSLPQELIDLTLDRYQQLSKRLTGKAAAAG
jgi:phosphoribosylaminoimidazole-succinocarboxamide synthase